MAQTTPSLSVRVPRGRHLRRRLGCGVLVLLAFILVGLVLFVYGRYLWRSEPSYWIDNRQFLSNAERAVQVDMADRVFNRILSELSNSRGYIADSLSAEGPFAPVSLGVRTIRIDFEDANAWLATRLNDWLINQDRSLPEGVSGPMVASCGDSLVVAFRYQGQDVDQVFSVLMSIAFFENGEARLSVDGVRGGRLPLPTRSVLAKLPGAQEDDTRRAQAIAVLLGETSFEPILPIDGVRRARIVGMRVDDQGVSITVRAESVD